MNTALTLKNVTKSYPEPGGRRLLVLDVGSFDLNHGEQVCLMGASGGGKTTLLNIIAGITQCDTGDVIIGGFNLSGRPEVIRDRFRASRLGYVFQTFNLLPAFTALENVLLGMSFGGQKPNVAAAKELLSRVGLASRLSHRPSQLSVGEQQRVSVARALINVPELLLADEPTANVDPANQQSVLDLLRETCRAQQSALLMVTHAKEIASQFERVVQLNDINRAGSPA